jgi:enoyl-[acyl-carrier protein] reductase I
VVLTGFGRGLRITERIARRLPHAPDVLELDAGRPEHLERVAAQLGERWDALDGVLHAIAFAPPDALGGNFLATSAESAEQAFRVSAWSYAGLAAVLRPLLAHDGGGALVGLDFDAAVAWPSYDWMGVAKAALEATNRYVARDLGPDGIRANLVAAGPLRTVAAQGIEGFDELAAGWPEAAPLGWDLDDPGPVADACLFLLSDAARAITGEVLHVDGGRHAMGGALATAASTRPATTAPTAP